MTITITTTTTTISTSHKAPHTALLTCRHFSIGIICCIKHFSRSSSPCHQQQLEQNEARDLPSELGGFVCTICNGIIIYCTSWKKADLYFFRIVALSITLNARHTETLFGLTFTKRKFSQRFQSSHVTDSKPVTHKSQICFGYHKTLHKAQSQRDAYHQCMVGVGGVAMCSECCKCQRAGIAVGRRRRVV